VSRSPTTRRPARLPLRTAVHWFVAVGALVTILLAAPLVPRPLDLLVMVLGLACYAAIAVRLRLVSEAEVERIRQRLTRSTARSDAPALPDTRTTLSEVAP
jgi:hypothetical protein